MPPRRVARGARASAGDEGETLPYLSSPNARSSDTRPGP